MLRLERGAHGVKRERMPAASRLDPSDPLWYKDAIIYQTARQGVPRQQRGRLRRLHRPDREARLHPALGVNAIWLLPFYPSPLKDDGYDIASYEEIHPTYGHDRATSRRSSRRRTSAASASSPSW